MDYIYQTLPYPRAILKAICAGVGFGSGTKTSPEDAHLHTFVFPHNEMRATPIVSGDRNYLLKHSQCEQCKPSRWPATKAIVHVFSVYVFLNTNETGLN